MINVNLLETIKNNFSKGYIDKAMEIAGLPSEYTAWTIKQKQWIGVAIALPDRADFSERFANVRLYTENGAEISGKEYTLLILRCDDPALRNEFSTICSHFVEPGEKGQSRKQLMQNPEDWWDKWKSLLGNRDTSTEAYPVIGELLTLEHLLKKGINAKWQGSEGGTRYIDRQM